MRKQKVPEFEACSLLDVCHKIAGFNQSSPKMKIYVIIAEINSGKEITNPAKKLLLTRTHESHPMTHSRTFSVFKMFASTFLTSVRIDLKQLENDGQRPTQP